MTGGQPHVLGPAGEILTLRDLPPAGTRRWTARRKAMVLAAVSGGLISVDEACRHYDLTLTEFAGWQRANARGGVAGLRVSQTQEGRDARLPYDYRP